MQGRKHCESRHNKDNQPNKRQAESNLCHVKRKEVCSLTWVRRKSWPDIEHDLCEPLRIVDLFSGCGGLTLGAWEAARIHGRKLDIRLAIDVSTDSINVYKANFKTTENIARQADIKSSLPGYFGSRLGRAEHNLQDEVGNVDLIVAGPPCQGHSDLNNSTRRRDPRNELYLKVIRSVELFNPKAIIIENVPTVIHDKENVVQRSLISLQALGYNVTSTVINAYDLGLPQHRKRHVLCAVKNTQFNAVDCFSSIRYKKTSVSDYLAGLEDESSSKEGIYYAPSRMSESNQERVAYLFKNKAYNLPNSLRPICHRDKDHSYVSMYGRLRWDQPAQTITSGFGSMGQGRYVHPHRRRTLTPHEAARLQGFPEFCDFSIVKKRTILQEMIGNAVPPRLAAILVSELMINKLL